MAEVGSEMTDRLQEAIGCPRDHIVVENVHSSFIDGGEVKATNGWPFVGSIISRARARCRNV